MSQSTMGNLGCCLQLTQLLSKLDLIHTRSTVVWSEFRLIKYTNVSLGYFFNCPRVSVRCLLVQLVQPPSNQANLRQSSSLFLNWLFVSFNWPTCWFGKMTLKVSRRGVLPSAVEERGQNSGVVDVDSTLLRRSDDNVDVDVDSASVVADEQQRFRHWCSTQKVRN